jgi:tellurite resistance protein
MAKRYTRSNTTTAELVVDYLDQRDEEVMQGLVTAGAFVALADGRVQAIERDELVKFLDGQRVVPAMSKCDIGEVFDCRAVRQW